MLFSLAFLSFILLSLCQNVHGRALLRKRATVCNGRAELCSRRYGDTTFLTSHNSFAYSSNPFALARTQAKDVPTQLRLGARALQGQAHMDKGQFKFCHTTCELFDGGLVVDYLKKVKTFMDANPYEVFTFIFTNPDRQSIPGVWKPAFDQAGLTPLAYVPPSRTMKRSDWPTLGELIDTNRRVVVFLDEGADGRDGGVVDFILPQFQMIWEDPFSPTDPNFPCRIDRVQGPLSNDDHMHLINHNLNVNVLPIGDLEVLVSDFVNSPKTNSLDSIIAHANRCAPFAQGRKPNFILLDYIGIGAATQAVDRLNGF